MSAANKLERIARDTRAGTGKWNRLHAINDYYFALIQPFARNLHESSSDRVFFHVIPFLGITLIRAKNVIEKARLPKLMGTATKRDCYRAF